MGTDIHVFVERKLGDKWVPVDPPRSHPPEWYEEAEKSGWSIDYIDWDDWARWSGIPKVSPLKQLADAGRTFEETIPEEACSWAFGRDYGAFGELAGVRRRGPLLMKPRGLPADVSPQVGRVAYCGYGTEEQALDVDWHTPHHYYLDELERFNIRNGGTCALREEMAKVANTYGLLSDRVRVVFWFDN